MMSQLSYEKLIGTYSAIERVEILFSVTDLYFVLQVRKCQLPFVNLFILLRLPCITY